MRFTARQIATILAALRVFQELSHEERNAMPQFDDAEALGDLEINELCERINNADAVRLIETQP